MWAAWAEDSLPSRRAWSTPGSSATFLAVSNSLIALPRDSPVALAIQWAAERSPLLLHTPEEATRLAARALPAAQRRSPRAKVSTRVVAKAGSSTSGSRDPPAPAAHRLFQTLEHRFDDRSRG